MKLHWIILAGGLLLAGCASVQNRAALEQYKRGCVTGNQALCARVPYQQAVNDQEASANALVAVKAAALVVLLPIVVLGAVAEARQEAGICGWGRHSYAC